MESEYTTEKDVPMKIFKKNVEDSNQKLNDLNSTVHDLTQENKNQSKISSKLKDSVKPFVYNIISDVNYDKHFYEIVNPEDVNWDWDEVNDTDVVSDVNYDKHIYEIVNPKDVEW